MSLSRIERGLAIAAYVVLRHGDTYAPILDRLEREAARAEQDDPQRRARAALSRLRAKFETAALPAHGGRGILPLD